MSGKRGNVRKTWKLPLEIDINASHFQFCHTGYQDEPKFLLNPKIPPEPQTQPMNLLTAKVSPNGRRFLIAAGIILAVTGLAKLFTVTGDTTLLRVADPIFGVEFRYLMAMVGITELVIAGFCFFSKREALSTLMIAWIASGFLVYRIGIRSVDWQRPCGCLGNLTDVLKISPHVAE